MPKIELKDAFQEYIGKIEVPEERIEQLFLDQDVEKKGPVIINIFLFIFGIWLLFYGVLKTYEFTSQKDPHGAVLKRMYPTEPVGK